MTSLANENRITNCCSSPSFRRLYKYKKTYRSFHSKEDWSPHKVQRQLHHNNKPSQWAHRSREKISTNDLNFLTHRGFYDWGLLWNGYTSVVPQPTSFELLTCPIFPCQFISVTCSQNTHGSHLHICISSSMLKYNLFKPHTCGEMTDDEM